MLDAIPSLATRRFVNMPYGNIDLAGATLLHLAVEFGETECADLLLDRGSDVNARVERADGSEGQTPVFHSVATFLQTGVPVLEHLLQRARVDLSVAASFRASGIDIEPAVTPLQWAERSRQDEAMSWRRASDQELELLQKNVRACQQRNSKR